MFVDAVMANVAVFAVGQVFAWLFLRSGRFWLGAGSTVALWTFIDWWLVSRYLLGTPAEGQQLPVLLLQATAIVTTFAWLWAKLRKRLAAPQRAERFQAGVQQLLAGKLADADVTFQKLAWSDPWDCSAWIARGDACRRLGVVAKARRCYRRAAGVDIRGGFRDVIAHRLKLLHNASEEVPVRRGQADARQSDPGEGVVTKGQGPKVQGAKAQRAKVESSDVQSTKAPIEKAQSEKAQVEKAQVEKVLSEKAPGTKSQAPKAETQKVEAQKPEAQKPEAQKPEAQKPEAQKPEAQKPGAQKPQTPKPATPKASTKKPQPKPQPRRQPGPKAQGKTVGSVAPPSGPLEKKRAKKSADPAKKPGRKAGSG